MKCMVIFYVFAVLMAAIALFILVCVIYADVRKSMIYLRSNRVTGLVVKKTGESAVPAYGTRRHRRYAVYHVRVSINGQERVMEAVSRKLDLAPGNILVVRYVGYPDGRLCEVFPYEWDRLREFLVGGVLGLLLGVACILYKLAE